VSLTTDLHSPLHSQLHSDLISRAVDGAILGASFDGINDYLTRASDLTGNVDSKLFTFAARIRMNGGDGINQIFLTSAGNSYAIYRNGVNQIKIDANNAAATPVLSVNSTSTFTANGYINILISVDMAGAIYLYVDDTDVASVSLQTNDIIDFTRVNHSVGANTSGTLPLNADINFLWFDNTTAIDFSVEANRRKFFDSSGNVSSLGADGSTPTGTSPIIYLAGDYSQWENNKGTGGGFTVTGALERPSS
jgi:hypothetical protein